MTIANRSYKFKSNTSKNIRVKTYDKSITVPVARGIGFDNIHYEKEIILSAVGLATDYSDGTFIDVGANIGQILMVLMVQGFQGEYIAFEPNLTGCAYIEKLIELNSLKNCSVFPLAISDDFSSLELAYNTVTDVCASTTDGFRPDGFFTNKRKVIALKGDTVLRQLSPDKIGVVKIDVEGGEVEVIRGLSDTLLKDKPLLLFEVLPFRHLETNPEIFPSSSPGEIACIVAMRRARTEELENLLKGMGYCWYRIFEDGTLAASDGLEACEPEQKTEMNFLAVQSDQKNHFEGHISEKHPDLLLRP